MRAACLSLGLALILVSRAPAADEPDKAITVFVAKKIITMDPGWPEGTAVAVQGGKVLSVGRTLNDLKPWLDRFPHTIDRSLANYVLLPGFIEAHGHPLLGATTLTLPLLTYLPTARAYGPDFPGVKSFDDAMAQLRQYVAAAKKPEETVFAWGYDVVAMGRHLTRHDLDKISAAQPILVWDASEHFVYANSAALKKAGITRADTAVKGVGADADGEPNGQFIGTTAAILILLREIGPLLEPDRALANMKYLGDLSRKNGITTTSELALGVFNLDGEKLLFERFFNNPATPLRCVVVVDGTSLVKSRRDHAVEAAQMLARQSNSNLLYRGVKFFSDDSYLGLGMMIENPGYTDGRKGLFIVEPGRDILAEFKPWWEAGFQIHVHTNGNAGNQSTIDALRNLQEIKPRFDHRFTLQHYGISTPDQARALKRLGASASVNPYYVYYRGELTAPLLGTDRAYTAARLKTLVDAGVPTSLHSDTPVGPPRPLEWMWIAVNRFGLSGKVLAPAERVTVQQALKMVTVDAAFTLGVEDQLGSIEPGKWADFTVLKQSPLEVPAEKIRNIEVWGTVSGGRVFPASEIRP